MRRCVQRHRRLTPAERQAAEQRARASIEAQTGRPLSDEEWREAATNLRQLMLLVASWKRSRHVVAGATDEDHD